MSRSAALTLASRWPSVRAIVAGFLVTVVLSLTVDEILHLAGIYPPWGDPMPQPALNTLALSYRCVITVYAMYLTARLAPRAPLKHALIGGAIGTVLGTIGAIGTMPLQLGPAWYPISLAASALPLAWLGGSIRERQLRARA